MVRRYKAKTKERYSSLDGRDRSGTISDFRIQPEPNTGCWLWLLSVNRWGYGRTTATPLGRRGFIFAHRLFWETAKGPIPSGMFLDHICRVKCCVNPDHLRVATPRQNSIENSNGVSAVNHRKAQCPRCGGPYVVRNAVGHRHCPRCHRLYIKSWRGNRRWLINERRRKCPVHQKLRGRCGCVRPEPHPAEG